MRLTTVFLAGFGFAIPFAHAANPIPEDSVKRLVVHQMCVRECDAVQMTERSSGMGEDQARKRHTNCKMDCNDVLTGRRPSAQRPAAQPAALR